MSKAIIISIIIVILAVLVGGYYGYQWRAEKIQLEEEAQAQAQAERERIMQAARSYVERFPRADFEYDVEIVNQLDKWALVNIQPRNNETDPAGVILEKLDNTWYGRDFGTILPGWEEKVPELFDFE